METSDYRYFEVSYDLHSTTIRTQQQPGSQGSNPGMRYIGFLSGYVLLVSIPFQAWFLKGMGV